MWYALAALGGAAVMLMALSLGWAANSKEDEARTEGWEAWHAVGLKSSEARVKMWRSLALDRVRKVKQLDESARLLGEALKTAMRERDEARAALAKMMHFAEADDIPDCNLPEWQDALDSARASLGQVPKEPTAPATCTPISLDRLLEIAAEAASLPASEEPAPHA